ncbi:4'-phosphopantetheinyl transferase family protein [Streptomyces jumonjinensis]|uniref:4'-phosphopantetheinyl transferase superfamily protein n=1 Tax=Streptomyces jumonjinensis TaxID=1945 RepID=A0A646KUN9_STRJU|nr:4'-phosphopantetheinyl transferase superfamily protein [Streptomyces jumonjinensis]MQT04716.1 4'-phosphopantetheinyl transferase superfamily protein [Streptomyces jumonjinensis]
MARTPRLLTPGAPIGPLGLPRAASRLWLADATRRPAVVEELARRVLDETEWDRAAALSRTADRRCYVTAHVALRLLLGAQLGIAADRVRFRREPCPCCGGPHGRPAPADPGVPLHFALSHSGDLALLAFAATPVGVDVQTRGSAEAADEVKGVLHPREEAELAACSEAGRPDAFARVWVRKEAYLKGLGTGLARSPSLDYLGTGTGAVDGPPGWRVEDITVPPGYAAAVAVAVEEPSGLTG